MTLTSAIHRQVPSLEMVLLVAYDSPRIEVWQRENGRWTSAVIGDGATIDVAPVGCQLPVADVFRDPLA